MVEGESVRVRREASDIAGYKIPSDYDMSASRLSPAESSRPIEVA